jgi:hypothetical protein
MNTENLEAFAIGYLVVVLFLILPLVVNFLTKLLLGDEAPNLRYIYGVCTIIYILIICLVPCLWVIGRVFQLVLNLF